MSYKDKIDPQRLPRHVAVIMDGNGRWAKSRGLDRSEGHVEGVNTVRKITEIASEIGIGYLTLYTFSTENWNRPQAEVDALMNLVVVAIERETADLIKNNVRLTMIGDFSRMPRFAYTRLCKCIDDTSHCTGLTLVLAISYSSRCDMPDPDLLIRTGGDHRVSNFLLWQIAYSEITVVPTFWPDFSKEDFCKAVVDYQSRERRFGKTSEQVSGDAAE